MLSYKNGELLAIEYNVWISGKKLGMDKKQCINNIQITETVDGSDMCIIKIADPEFLYIEDNIFIEDNKIKVQLGWVGVSYRVKFEGYISAIDIIFQESGLPLLTVTCMDNTHLMNRKKKSNTFKNTTNAKVVQKIVKSYGFKCVIESGYAFEKQETITQSNQTDIDFITQLAGNEVYPFTARLIGNTFYYVKKGHLKDPKMTLTYLNYPHDLISFSPKINKESAQVEVGSSVVKSSNKKLSSTKVTSKRTTDSKTKNTPSGGSNSGRSYTYNPNKKTWS